MRSRHWRILSRSGHWRIESSLKARQGNQRQRRAGRTSGNDGARRGGSSISSSLSQAIRSPSMSCSPRCIISSATVQGRSSIPRSDHPQLAPSWWALLPVLAPGLTGWDQLAGHSSAQSLGFALDRSENRISVIGGLGLMRITGSWWETLVYGLHYTTGNAFHVTVHAGTAIDMYVDTLLFRW